MTPGIASVIVFELRVRSEPGFAVSRHGGEVVALERAQVAFVPGEAFGAPGYARFSYALGDQALAEGITRLAKFVAG